MPTINENIKQACQELLDLSLKNPLLNFKLRKNIGLELKNVNSIEVFHLLNEGKLLSFTNKLEVNRVNKILCDIPHDELIRRLSKTSREAKLIMEEKGCNVLFLALGFVKWYEKNNTSDFIYAPLVLIPIALKKAFDMEKYSVVYTEEDIKLNISLITKFKQDFNIDLNYDLDNFSIENYFYHVNNILQDKTNVNFELIDDIGAIDFFSYAKFLMYMDLESIENVKTFNDSVLYKIFNDGFTTNPLRNDIRLVNAVGADYSQNIAIKEVLSDNDLVIQGPPGTGKSQTITNIIANAVYNDKKVLFVSEKKAALDVVKRRLDSTGLSDLVLELHSQKANKKDVLQAIEKTLRLGEPRISDINQTLEKYDNIGKYLDRYAQIINTDVKNSSLPLISIYGLKLELEDKLTKNNIKIPKLEIDGIEDYSEDDFLERYELLKEYIDTLKIVGKVTKNPYYGLSLNEFLPFQEAQLKEKLDDLLDSFNTLITHTQELSSMFNGRSIYNIFDFKHFYDSIMYCKDFKGSQGMNSADYRFSEDRKFIFNTIETGLKAQEFYNEYKDVIESKAFLLDNKFETNYQNYLSSGVFFIKDKQKETKILSYFKDDLSRNTKLKLAKKLYNLKKELSHFKKNRKQIKEVFNMAYTNPYDTDWASLKDAVPFLFDLHDLINDYTVIAQMKFACMDYEVLQNLVELAKKVEEDIALFEATLLDFCEIIEFDSVKRFGYSKWYLDLSFNDLKRIFYSFKNNASSVYNLARYNNLEEQMHKLNLTQLVDFAQDFKEDLDYIIDIFVYMRYETLVNNSFEQNAELKDFKSFKHERQREIFKDLNNKLMLENIKQILKKHFDLMPKFNESNYSMNILRRELLKKKNHMPLRKLISQTKESLLKIKPVFMMSPISIATFLEPGEIEFDLVIFDEASQVRPVEAFGALLRCKKAIVVGDSKQLPPTNFFENITEKNDDLENDDFVSLESILSLFLAKKAKETVLSIHYRSKHHSLIETSNEEFYDNKLEIFPSVDYKDQTKGLIFNYNPTNYYNRGTTRTNPLEAEQIIDAIVKHAHENSDLTLGVVAFSTAQTEEIYKRLGKRIKQTNDEVLKSFLNMHPYEPFFIKNLENVQGDERDVIFISIGYGRDKEGNLTMDFGPLNKDGGERRLNVIITRAKLRCEVFANINCYDINLSKTNAKGVKALKHFLEYAEFRNDNIEFKEENQDSFVSYLYERLLRHGFNVDKYVGSKNQVIDLAVKDPNNPNKYLVGILCDGTSYYKKQDTVDRDILQDSMLNQFKWHIYRVWSTDFYQNAKYEFEKLLDFINQSMKQTLVVNEEKQTEVVIKRKASQEINKDLKFVDYQLYSGPMRRQSIWNEKNTIVELACKIINVEAPIYYKEIQRRLMTITKLTKLSVNNKEMLEQIYQELKWNEKYQYKDGFFYIKEANIVVRNRENTINSLKKLETVCDDEIRLCLYTLVNYGKAQTLNDLTNMSANVFGYNKPTDKFKGRILKALNDLVTSSLLYIEDEVYFINEGVKVIDEEVIEDNQ